MDTGRLKRFATEARNILMQGVAQRFIAVGFNADGGVEEEPMAVEGGCVFMGEVQSTEFYNRWMSLKRAVEGKGINEVAEEAAYTWFNRMVALRIMAKNGLASPVLEYESADARVPYLVADARHGMLPVMDEGTRLQMDELLEDDSKTAEQFRVLIVAYCHGNPVIDGCFGHIADYTALLLPNNILAEGGFVDMLNNTEFVTDEDYHSPELIGWLYQFYIAEKKDDVFASFKRGMKAEAKDIPAATQIFTPNWIVKYMVQNTVGRIYLDNNPYSGIGDTMQYLVVPQETTPTDATLHIDDLHKLTCADLACGSGHILNECFDLLYQCYVEEGYSRRQAVEDIFRYNLTGIDLDTRAKQLAQFALLMKACQKDASFKDGRCMPRVYDMPEPYGEKDKIGARLTQFLMGANGEAIAELKAAFELMDEAQNLGSIMKFDVSERTRNMVAVRMEEYERQDYVEEEVRKMMPYMNIILALTEKYAALVANPPYMGSGNMNNDLSKYVKDNYEEGKADLFSTFMMLSIDRLADNGKYGMINMQSWMFLSSFEKMRSNIIDSQKIDSVLHLGPRTFDELSGEVVQNTAFIITKTDGSNSSGSYFRLVDGKNCRDKERMFLEANTNHTNKIYYPNVSQSNFKKIPGCPLGYWVTDTSISNFSNFESLDELAIARVGLITGDSSRFIRNWQEVSINNIGFGIKNNEDSIKSKLKWFPIHNGGGLRKWYGNLTSVLNWENDGYEMKYDNYQGTRVRSHNYNGDLAFKESLSWNTISSDKFTCRYAQPGFMFDTAGPFAQVKDSNKLTIFNMIGLLNSKIANIYLSIVNPTINFPPGCILSLPCNMGNIESSLNIKEITKKCISLSRLDWDAHETSWDFKENELVRMQTNCRMNCADLDMLDEDEAKEIETLMHVPTNSKLLSDCYEAYKSEWRKKFYELHANEEELNRQFIEIYGLQDELTPEVPLDEITILQQGEISIRNNELVWHADVVVKQLISYAVGCMMGRYSIDKTGLILANQGDGVEEYQALVPGSRFEIDDDGIIPLMSSNTEFADCATKRFKTWLASAFGEDHLVDNLNFVEQSIGKSLDDYFVKDFWKDHKKMYQNRPIYWLFSSKKGAFQCLAYMHRMTPYTAEAIRTKYLLPHIEWLMNKQNEMEADAANLTTRERRELDDIRKQVAECREYHDRLHEVADQMIAFDLDDGVVVNYAKFGDVLGKIK